MPDASALANLSIFPADNPWRKDISQAPLDARSSAIINFLNQTNAPLFNDFGSGLYLGSPIGIPFVVVCGNQPTVPITYRGNTYDGNYGNESDPGPFPIPLSAPVEGNGGGDSHVIAVDAANHKLYELYNASVTNTGWQASSGAKFDLNSNALRPLCYTSADAAGLPIFPGLVRYDEVASGTIRHPIRFTLNKSLVSPMFVAPARHYVNGTNTNAAYPTPMGMRLRLKASVNIGGYSANNRVILTAMKTYGIILADIGSNFYISGAPDPRWNNSDLQALRAIRPSDFEVVQMGSIFDSGKPADVATCAP
ncbi:hypothetical protein [Massilia sp. CF038]|uniref:hypothetical protein n=1 Tax=Massilia sp. CF038 TaxID=1881045 RepID=UPI00091C4588|nr:hypothetical protein [Massilia sp. CF038]SHH73677.1 hypothetical protein SAMN05428948_5180 [Massilia sp. CF038]